MDHEKIEDKLEHCLRFDTEQFEESELEKLARKAVSELRKLRNGIKGLTGYAWKDGEYIDSIEDYFEDIEEV